MTLDLCCHCRQKCRHIEPKWIHFIFCHASDGALEITMSACRLVHRFGPDWKTYQLSHGCHESLDRHSWSLVDETYWFWGSPDFSSCTTSRSIFFGSAGFNHYLPWNLVHTSMPPSGGIVITLVTLSSTVVPPWGHNFVFVQYFCFWPKSWKTNDSYKPQLYFVLFSKC